MRGALWVGFLLAATACGAGSAELADDEPGVVAPATDSAAFLLEVGGNLVEVLARPSEDLDTLEAARRAARGTERLRAQRDLARAHLYAAEVTEGREQRAHFRAMNELTTTSGRVRDEALSADLDFLGVWVAWRAGQRNAEGRAQRFVAHHESSRDLLMLVWLIRGEIAFSEEHWDDALEDFRAVLGHLGHPLYAFALYRSARVWHEQGRSDDSVQALREVRDLGCAADAGAPTMHIALAATHALGESTRPDASGHERPESCADAPATTSTGGGLEDERPPVLQ